ncbi:hypothetical protein SUGI_0191930 [Cryptomeria japonica]|uniref:phosphate transporter PHO1 homolog 1 n=1 Tax=Cryptomeria japonica TaxID=3369 RepID=UPI002408A5FF|nr:phosphate transporter PHO1 homolog 1 [Cryptomeria japonica]GLJ12485.1 hypothetical protein SUGI_0191930 [Cryptomeria japonica]
MVKFSKQFEAQLVPEWKEAFVNYWQLKKEVKKIQKNLMKQRAMDADHPASPHDTRLAFFSHFTTLVKRKTRQCLRGDSEPGIIRVSYKTSGSAREDVYETEVLNVGQGPSEETDAAAQAFFNTLDAQLNKVNQFYKSKEKDFLERGESLKQQMIYLTELKAALRQRAKNGDVEGGSNSRHSNNSVDSNDSVHECEEDGQVDEEEEAAGDQELQVVAAFEKNGVTFVESPQRRSTKAEKSKEKLKKLKSNKYGKSRSFNLQGRNMRMEIPATTPSRTISALNHLIWEDLLSQPKKSGAPSTAIEASAEENNTVSKKNIHHAEKMIRKAFVELYRGLGFLKTYRSLNMLAFVKILKKFDKVTGQQVLPIYLNVVERSYFNSSDKVIKLSDEIEELFVQQFADDNRRKAMKYLRPKQPKESHTVTFLIGLFTGCFLALFVGYIIMAHIAGTYTDRTDPTYMEIVYPVFSLLTLLNLHIFLYGCNIFMWRRHRINHVFIFEFKRNRELKYQDVFLFCTTFMTIVVGTMVAHLALRAKGFSPVDVDTIPGFLLLASIAVLVCPLNMIYRPTRYAFLRAMRNIILSPLYKVVMVDFFMADQLTSQVPLLRQLEYVICYYGTGSFRSENYSTCTNNKHYRDLVYVVSFLPYYWRAMQCARRWFDEGDLNHIANLGKYVSAMVAAGARLTYEKQQNMWWLSLVVITSTIATVYQLYWDFVKDWGLLSPRSKNPWLRDELILKHKFIYFISMVLNLLLRLAWLQTIMHSSFESVDYRVTGFFLASLEVIRRGHWNFYRLENEHLTNVGKFRATKIVPLPFHEVDED